jgi:hypothetical protein
MGQLSARIFMVALICHGICFHWQVDRRVKIKVIAKWQPTIIKNQFAKAD